MRRIRAALLTLVIAAGPLPASAAMLYAEGFETQSKVLACPNGNGGTETTFDTSVQRSGAAVLKLTHTGTNSRGSCAMTGSWAQTGTIIVFTAIRLSTFGSCTNLTVTSPILDLGEVTLNDTCSSSTNNHTISVRENSQDIGTNWTGLNDQSGTYYPIAIKIVTDAGGAASVSWRVSADGQNWTDQGTSTGRTIANVDQLIAYHPQSLSGISQTNAYFDDILVLNGSGTAWPDPRTFVNMRAGKASTPTYNEWTKVGGTNIYDSNVWGVRTGLAATTYSGTCTAGSNAGVACKVASECPSSVCAGWAISPQSDGGGNQAEQTMKIAAWDSGTPTPTIPASATGVNAIWGCRWQTLVGRTTSTNRSYALRYAWNSTASDTSISLSAETYTSQSTILDLNGGTPSSDLSKLNTLEVGGVRTSTAAGANMVIRDHWVQCAWSEAGTGGLIVWTQDEE